jgi:hypothetical protein
MLCFVGDIDGEGRFLLAWAKDCFGVLCGGMLMST